MHELKLNNDVFFIPQSWNELTKKNLLDVAELLITTRNPVDFKTKLFLRVTGLQIARTPEKVIDENVIDEKVYFVLVKKDKKYLVSSYDMNVVVDTLDFLFSKVTDKEGNVDYVVESKLIKQLIPVIETNNNPLDLHREYYTYYGPDDALSNLHFEEFMFTETYYNDYVKTNDIAHLNKLIAVLYRTSKPEIKASNVDFNGDFREPFNTYKIESNAKKIHAFEPHIKKAIFLYYYGCRNFIIDKYSEVYKPDTSTSTGTKTEKVSTFENFMKLVNALANNDVTKNESIRKSMLYEVMVTLNELAIQRRKLEESIKH